jgi:hypothetical protein
LSPSDREKIARVFSEWRKTVTLTPIGRWLGHNAAWDNYFCGYSDGVADGVNRALGISEKEEAAINDFLADAEAWNSSASAGPQGQFGEEAASTSPSTARQQTDARAHVLRVIGGIVCSLGIVRGLGVLRTAATNISQAWPNIISVTLLTAFGVATYRGDRAAMSLGWACLALFVFMTVVHDFVPLEIFQCLALGGFLLYLHRQQPM